MNSSAPPPAPAPLQVIGDQTAANKATAVTNYGLNATNQVTPYGSLSYTQDGTWSDGTPKFGIQRTITV